MINFSLNEYFANAGTDVLRTLITYRKSDRNEEHHNGVDPGFFCGGATWKKLVKIGSAAKIDIFQVFLMF